MSRVTISDVARHAGVSVGTVSNMLNHSEKVLPPTRAVIQKAIDELGFVPNRNARVLAGGRNHSFGLILTGLDHDLSLQLARGVQDEARKGGFELLIASAENDDVLGNRYYDYFQGAQMSGVILEPRVDYGWKNNGRASLPTVILDVHGNPADGCYVAADNVLAGRLAAEHAVELGKHRLLVVSSDDHLQSLTDRDQGVDDVLADVRGVFKESLHVADWRSSEEAYALGRSIARRDADSRPDFVIALTDVLGAGIIEGLLDEGLSVPGDIAVMGCDGNPMAWGGRVPLTTIAPHGEEMGQRAARLLIDEVKRPEEHRHVVEVVASELLVRESTIGR